MSSNSSPVFRALAIGFYGAPNVGDEVLLDVLVRRVTEVGGEIVVASIDPANTRRMHGVDSIQFSNLGEICHALLHCDVLIMGGGGIFQDHHPFNLEALYLPYANDIAGYARPMLLARQFGVPVIVWGHGVGPLRQAGSRALVRDLFEHARVASVRDADSLRLLRDIGVNREITVAADPGWLFSTYHPVPEALPSDGRTLAVVVREWEKGSWKQPLLKALASALPSGWRVQWIAFQAHTEGSGATSDLPLVEGLAQQDMRPGDEVVAPSGPEEAWEYLARADAVFSMRLHASILALLAGRPTCGLEYDDKLSKAHSMARMPDVCRLAIGDGQERYEAAIRTVTSGEWRPDPQVIEELQASARAHLVLLDNCIGLPRRLDTFDAGQMDWLSVWLQEALREAKEQAISSRRAHELLNFRDVQLTESTRLLEQASQEEAETREMLAERSQAVAALEDDLETVRRKLEKTEADLLESHARAAEFRMQAAASNSELIERNRGMMEQMEARIGVVERKLQEAEVALANTRDELDQKRAYIDDKEIYIAMLRAQLDETQARLEESQREIAEARDLWRRIRMGAQIARRDLLRALAAPFTLIGVWRQHGYKVALQQIPRRMKTIGVAPTETEPLSALPPPMIVRPLRRERLLVIAAEAFDADGWPTRPMQLAQAAERAGFHVRICVLVGKMTPDEDASGQLQRLSIDAAGWLNEVRAEECRVLLAASSLRAVELATSSKERGAEVIVDFAMLGEEPTSHAQWPSVRAIASRGIHAGKAPAADMPLLLIEEGGDNDAFDAYRSYAYPSSYSRNRANVLVIDLEEKASARVADMVQLRHDALFHVLGSNTDGLADLSRVRTVPGSLSPAELAPLISHADSVVLLGSGRADETRRLQIAIASLLLEKPTLVEAELPRLSSVNLHLVTPGSLAAQLAIAGVEDHEFISSHSWLGRVESLMAPAYPESISVVVLIHNNRRIIERCVRTILDHAGAWLEEVVVVDNQSIDGGAELVEEVFDGNPKVKLVRNSENGCSSGRNLGVKHSSGKYIAFFDSDQWLTSPTCFPEAIAILNMDEGVGAIGWNAGWFDGSRDDLGGPISDYLPHRGMNAEAFRQGFRDDIGFLGTSCMFMTRELFEKIEGFDTFYDPTCFEDTDICFQIKRAGYSVAFRDLAGVRHQPHQTTGASEGSERYKRLFNRNAAYFREKWQGYPEFFVNLKSWH